jgi:transposase
LHVIGEDVSERLDKVSAKLRLSSRGGRKYACRSCTDGIVLAPAANRSIEGSLPTEALVADVLVSKYADHLPFVASRRFSRAEASTPIGRRWNTRSASLRPLFLMAEDFTCLTLVR